MRTISQMKQHLALTLNERAIKNREDIIFTVIFRRVDGTPYDCGACQYAKECEISNPAFDANYCKFS